MITQPIQSERRRAWRRMRLWQRVIVIAVLLGMLLISAALIYFAPGAASGTNGERAGPSVAATAGPLYPPGTRYYYRRGQWFPLDQQEPPQP